VRFIFNTFFPTIGTVYVVMYKKKCSIVGKATNNNMAHAIPMVDK